MANSFNFNTHNYFNPKQAVVEFTKPNLSLRYIDSQRNSL